MLKLKGGHIKHQSCYQSDRATRKMALTSHANQIMSGVSALFIQVRTAFKRLRTAARLDVIDGDDFGGVFDKGRTALLANQNIIRLLKRDDIRVEDITVWSDNGDMVVFIDQRQASG